VRRVRPDVPEISPVVFEELLVNALMHRDYLISAPIRLFIFDNRIEIISPGHLPNNLTVAKKLRAHGMGSLVVLMIEGSQNRDISVFQGI
jgi:predicted HTH transcriptional regulator